MSAMVSSTVSIVPSSTALRSSSRVIVLAVRFGWRTFAPTLTDGDCGLLLLGIDEGTTGVKAALFDERLRPVREARRDKLNRHPQPGWVEQDGEEVLAAVVEAGAELLQDAPRGVVGCRAWPPSRAG